MGKFIKTLTYQQLTPDANRKIAAVASRISRVEGMEGHARSADSDCANIFRRKNSISKSIGRRGIEATEYDSAQVLAEALAEATVEKIDADERLLREPDQPVTGLMHNSRRSVKIMANNLPDYSSQKNSPSRRASRPRRSIARMNYYKAGGFTATTTRPARNPMSPCSSVNSLTMSARSIVSLCPPAGVLSTWLSNALVSNPAIWC